MKIIIANQKSVNKSERKLANKIIKNESSFFSNFIPFKEYVGILDIIKIAGRNK